jgi:hypothetical protein
LDLSKFNQISFDRYAAYLKSIGLSDANIQQKLSSLSSFQKFLIKRKLIQVPDQPLPSPTNPDSSTTTTTEIPINPTKPKNFFQNLQSQFLFRYIIIFSIFAIIAGIGYTLYRQTILQSQKNLAYSTASTMITGGRFLSFQGRLTDSSGNPITSSTSIVFKLYNIGTIGSGTTLYTSQSGNSQTVVPDENGIFSVTIGKSHGTTIPSSVFTENSEIWLEITAGGEAMSPRQQIATVGYALNSETLQGLPPSASGTKNTVLVIDGTGNLNLGETSPTIKSTSGTLGIEGQAVLIKASDGSGGNITINPDSNGEIKLITEGTGVSDGFINASNANLTSGNLFNAFINNTNRGYNFINFSNYNIGTTVLSSRFSIDAYGNTIIGNNLTIGGTFVSVGSTNLVANLNADLLDGYHASSFLGVGSSSNFISNITVGGSGLTISGSGVGRTITNTGLVGVSNGTLTRLGSNGTYTVGLNLANANTWTGLQTFNATGAPFAVGSSTKVTNLNADLLDGYDSSAFIYTAGNGLTLASNTFKLGGILSQNTDIGFSGFSLTFSDGGSTFASFSSAGNTFYNPTTFTSAGDVSMAYDLNFTNSTSSTIRSQAPLYIQTESPYANLDINLTAANQGQIYLNSNAQLTQNLTVGGTFVSVGSTNIVTNLNADLLDGYHASSFMQVGTTDSLTAGTDISITGSGVGRTINDTSTLSSVTGRGSSTSTLISLLGGAYFGSTSQSILKSNGSIGIGTTNPGYKLEISGDALISTRLGIGATNTSFAFNVSGNGNVTGKLNVGTTLFTSSFAVGNTLSNPASVAQISYSDTSTTTASNGLTLLNYSATTGNLVGIRLSTYGGADGGLYPKQFIGANR